MAELDDEQYKLLDSYLEYKYYMPEITKVYSIKDNMRGAIFVKADTTSGQKTICIRDWYQNFRMIGYDYLTSTTQTATNISALTFTNLTEKAVRCLKCTPKRC